MDDLERAFVEAEIAVMLAEAEHAVALAEADAGARLPAEPQWVVTDDDARAGLRLGPMWRRIHHGADAVTTMTDPVAAHVIESVEQAASNAPSVQAAQAQIAAWASPVAPTVMPGLAERVKAASAQIEEHLREVWDASAADVAAEATHQGVPALAEPPALTPGMLLTLGTLAVGIATARASRLMSVADKTAQGVPSNATPKAMATALTSAVTAVKPAGTTDLARQAIHTTQGAARNASVRSMVKVGRTVADIHVTEQMDTGTCGACMRLNGTHYGSLEEAWADYRPEGGCLWCEGGLRCRGVLVVTWASETPATVQEPYGTEPPVARPITQPTTPPPEPENGPVAPGTPGQPPAPPGTPATPSEPEPIRAIPLDISRRVDVGPTERAVHSPKYNPQLDKHVSPTRTFEEARERIGGEFDPVREQPAVDWAGRRDITLLHVELDDVIKWPDAVNLDAVATVEVKKMDESTWTSFLTQVWEGGLQSRHILIDARDLQVSADEATAWLRRAIKGNSGKYVDQVVVILDPGSPPLEWSRV